MEFFCRHGFWACKASGYQVRCSSKRCVGANASCKARTAVYAVSPDKEIFVVERCIVGVWPCASYNGGCSVTSADFQQKPWSRALRTVYSEVPEAPDTTYDETLQTSGMNTLHTRALEDNAIFDIRIQLFLAETPKWSSVS